MAAVGLLLILTLAVFSECGEAKQLHVYASMKMNWFEAFEHCRSMKKNLVSLMSQQDHKQLQNAVWKCSQKCGEHIEHSWTSGSDLHKRQERQFVWMTTGKEVAADRWAADHPSDNWTGDEDCIEAFDIPKEKQVVLNDRPCNDEMQYVICESN